MNKKELPNIIERQKHEKERIAKYYGKAKKAKQKQMTPKLHVYKFV